MALDDQLGPEDRGEAGDDAVPDEAEDGAVAEEPKGIEPDADADAEEEKDEGGEEDDAAAHGRSHLDNVDADAAAASSKDVFGAAADAGADSLRGEGASGADDQGGGEAGGGGGEGGQSAAAAGAAPERPAARQHRRSAPNPLRSAGDASQHWHKRLDVSDAGRDEDAADPGPPGANDMDDDGAADARFEYAAESEAADAQALGGAGDDAQRAENLDGPDHADDDAPEGPDGAAQPDEDAPDDADLRAAASTKADASAAKRQTKEATDDEDKDAGAAEKKPPSGGRQNNAPPPGSPDGDAPEPEKDEEEQGDDAAAAQIQTDDDAVEGDGRVARDAQDGERSRVVQVVEREDDDALGRTVDDDDEDMDVGAVVAQEASAEPTRDEAAAARAVWREYTQRASPISRRLCESLRSVLEPTVASRLKGDYRTGKRLSMRRVLEYVASGYRRDKIWLRRTKAAKRAYHVLLAIDDSKSMKDSGAVDAAFLALAAITSALQQLDVGDVAVARFGETAQVVRGFGRGAWSDDAAADACAQFTFAQESTRGDALLGLALDELAQAAATARHGTEALQLALIVSDGRFDHDSRAALRRKLRAASEAKVAVVLVLLDRPGADSVLHMQHVAFDSKGSVQLTPYLDDFPFPCYVLLRDCEDLPDVLAQTLKQWFELHSYGGA
ncbi:hypothetical protein M885DRAFT_540695 [Pelagophyceae sp. CCMP2097]|nr:hypothetical protein M885DRAFT_540695 [Pelagophyceae sp. CCMP2097]